MTKKLLSCIPSANITLDNDHASKYSAKNLSIDNQGSWIDEDPPTDFLFVEEFSEDDIENEN